MEKAKQAETIVLTENPSLVIRTSAFFGPWDQLQFCLHSFKFSEKKAASMVTDDVIVSPTYVPDLANTAMDLFIDEEKGIWHFSNEGMTSWADFAGIIAEDRLQKK